MISQLLKPVKAQLELQTILFRRVLSEISDDEANELQGDNMVPVKWIAGHIVNTRITLWSILSGKAENADYSKLFGKGTSKIEGQAYPAIDEIMEQWETITSDLMESLSNCTDDFLASKPPFQTSIPDNTMMGLVAFLTIHEAHHIGQISVLRKLYGTNPSSDFKLYESVICN